MRSSPAVRTRVVVDPNVRYISSHEGAVLLHLGRGRYESLNGPGAAIWSDIVSGASSDEIVSHVCDRFPGAPQERIESDVARFIDGLASRGLVTLEPLS